MEGSCAFMAARLKQAAREQRSVVRAAVHAVLRDVVKMSEQRMAMSGGLARHIWGTVNKRGTWRANYWRGRRVTQKSLGLYSRTKARDRGGAKWARWTRDYDRSRVAAERYRARRGQKKGEGIGSAPPLIVRVGKMKWSGEVLKTGVYMAGIAANIEAGKPFKPHGRHPGGPVHPHPVLQKAMESNRSQLGANVRAAVEGYLAGVVNG